MTETKRGRIILIEGTDGSGKETQSVKLVSHLIRDGVSCERMSFPRYKTPTGRIVGQCYLGKVNLGEGDTAWFGEADGVDPRIASLYYAADRLAAVPEIMRIIDSGSHLVLDRYVESNMAHQGGKATTQQERSDIVRFISSLEYGHLNLPLPDLTFFLYMPLKAASFLRTQRGEAPDGHESNLEHLRRAEETYLELAQRFKWRRIDCAPDGTVDSLRRPEEIHEEVYSHVVSIL